GLVPTGRGFHPGDGHAVGARGHAADVLVDDLAPGDGDTLRGSDQFDHVPSVTRRRAQGIRMAPAAPGAHAVRSVTSACRSGRLPLGAVTYAPVRASSARSMRAASSVCSVSTGSPARTPAPGLTCISTPAPACTVSPWVLRPAPSRHAATPIW